MTFNVSVMMKSYKVKNRQIDKGCLHLQTLICCKAGFVLSPRNKVAELFMFLIYCL